MGSFPHGCQFQSHSLMKNGVLAVQTIRNNIMASTLLTTTAITLTSQDSETKLVYGNKSSLNSAIKRLSISLCFLLAFLCNMFASPLSSCTSWTLPLKSPEIFTLSPYARCTLAPPIIVNEVEEALEVPIISALLANIMELLPSESNQG
ncbi:hypothetical protein PIB30_009510 [Stylosanthes scabra]|uniref:Uncharacterized protein n=1 Tax=Stylosanthes scabra TaxID=79078 RepID=A0ABU6Y2E5_9FABA|nr:hypothetical protein [Stylosanthes scabra]